jgi:hypothetical protein
MLLQLQNGTLEPNMHKFKNLLESAIYYEAQARALQGQIVMSCLNSPSIAE